jgi:TolA-binding protein
MRLDQLRAWEGQLEAEVDRLSAELAQLQHQVTTAKEQLELVRRLVRLNSEDRTGPVAPASTDDSSDWSLRADLEHHVKDILEKAGEPMHIGAIREELLARAVPLPGRGDEANIIVRLSRASETFVRTARGTYGLVAWGLTPMPKRSQRRSTKKERTR